jgi:pimeloyl-[acyl-carrier protein] methyl ester esterase
MKVEITGRGPTLLYLHDWGFPGQSWARQVEFFRAKYRNVVVDFNLTECPAELGHEDLLGHLCDDLLAQLEPGDRTPRAVIAHGFGTFLAYELIDRGLNPDALVLLGGLVRFTNTEGYLSGLPQERVSAMRKALQADAREMLRRYAQFAFSGADEAVPDATELALPYQAADFLRLTFDTLISHDYADVIPRLPCRALIIHGEHDRISPIWQGELLRKLFRQSEFHLCRGAGHVPFLTQFAAINRRIEQFLEPGT